MSLRPAVFDRMGPAFLRGFGNAEAVFTIAGTARNPVKAIVRQWREPDMMEAEGQAVEGASHVVAVASGDIAGLVSQRDSVTLHILDKSGARTGVTVAGKIRNQAEDGRAMTKLWIKGNI